MVEMTRDLNELHPKVKALALSLLEECKKQGMNIGISETYRSIARQDYLYAQGRTRAGAIVTYTKGSEMQSYHQWRLAFDVFNNVRGAEYDSNILKRVGAIGMKLGLEWGGSWSGFYDTPHFQYTFGLSIKDLKAGKRPPEEDNSLPNKINVNNDLKEQEKYLEAIKYFRSKKIITTIDAWVPDPNLKFVEILIINIGKNLFNTTSYTETIKKLVNLKIITSAELWFNKDYKIEYVKMLLIKIYDYMKNN